MTTQQSSIGATLTTQQSPLGPVVWKRLASDQYYPGLTSITLPCGDQWVIPRSGSDVDAIFDDLIANLDLVDTPPDTQGERQ